MEVVEQSVVGKSSDATRCEDLLVVTEHLVAVIDGSTDVAGILVRSGSDKITPGRFAALTIADVLKKSDPEQDPVTTVAHISEALYEATKAAANQDGCGLPAASIVVFNSELRVVWRVGDCPFRIDSNLHNKQKRIDEVASSFRAAVIAASTEKHETRDLGREALLPLLRIQGLQANKAGEFGYGRIDGRPVPLDFIEMYDVPAAAREVVLASDGYPTLPSTLAKAEEELADRLAKDPSCTGLLRGTKGLEPGQNSFDDRAWVRIVL